MKDIPEFVLDNAALTNLSEAVGNESLKIEELGASEEHGNGTEQGWKCGDQCGDLFRFVTVAVNDRNTLGLKKGEIYLIVLPLEKGAAKRKPKEVSEAFNRFERNLITLGAKRRSPQ